jgi:hypothetical protein
VLGRSEDRVRPPARRARASAPAEVGTDTRPFAMPGAHRLTCTLVRPGGSRRATLWVVLGPLPARLDNRALATPEPFGYLWVHGVKSVLRGG